MNAITILLIASAVNIVVIAGGLALIVGIALFFWGPRTGGVRAAVTSSGYQVALVLVKGGYTPDVIMVQHGKPVRLTFRREETAACSEMVVLGDFGKSARLPEGQTVPVEFLQRNRASTSSPARWACSAAG